MWFPFQKTPRKTSVDGAIERYRRARPTRPMLGLHVDAEFRRISGAAVEIRGSGKWMRIRLLGHLQLACRESLAEECRRVTGGLAAAGETVGIGSDLGEYCADVVDQLLAKSSLSVEDVLAVCIDEPGIRWSDYDGRPEFAPLLQPQRFAERTGLSVIDALSSADVAAGGCGGPLSPLPMWLLFADRRPPLARASRWLVQLDHVCTLTLFPPSDGLDAELPEIRRWVLPGLGLFDALDRLRDASRSVSEEHHELPQTDWASDRTAALAVQGRSQPALMEQLRWPHPDRPSEHPWQFEPARPGGQQRTSTMPLIDQWMNDAVQASDRIARQAGMPWADVYCSATHAIVEQISEIILAHPQQVTDVILAGRGRRNGLLVSGLHKIASVNEVAVVDDCGFHSDALPGICSAVLGMMHVDQLPASLPWITGCLVPRLHGRATPGRPAYWRRLVTEMADFHPPAMKLRDAV